MSSLLDPATGEKPSSTSEEASLGSFLMQQQGPDCVSRDIEQGASETTQPSKARKQTKSCREEMGSASEQATSSSTIVAPSTLLWPQGDSGSREAASGDVNAEEEQPQATTTAKGKGTKRNRPKAAGPGKKKQRLEAGAQNKSGSASGKSSKRQASKTAGKGEHPDNSSISGDVQISPRTSEADGAPQAHGDGFGSRLSATSKMMEGFANDQGGVGRNGGCAQAVAGELAHPSKSGLHLAPHGYQSDADGSGASRGEFTPTASHRGEGSRPPSCGYEIGHAAQQLRRGSMTTWSNSNTPLNPGEEADYRSVHGIGTPDIGPGPGESDSDNRSQAYRRRR